MSFIDLSKGCSCSLSWVCWRHSLTYIIITFLSESYVPGSYLSMTITPSCIFLLLVLQHCKKPSEIYDNLMPIKTCKIFHYTYIMCNDGTGTVYIFMYNFRLIRVTEQSESLPWYQPMYKFVIIEKYVESREICQTPDQKDCYHPGTLDWSPDMFDHHRMFCDLFYNVKIQLLHGINVEIKVFAVA